MVYPIHQKPFDGEAATELDNISEIHRRKREQRSLNPPAPPAPSHSTHLGLLIPWILINAGFLIWLVIYTLKVTQPYKYPEWVFGNVWGPNRKAMITLLVFLSPTNAILAVCIMCNKFSAKTAGGHTSSAWGCFALVSPLVVIFCFIWPLTWCVIPITPIVSKLIANHLQFYLCAWQCLVWNHVRLFSIPTPPVQPVILSSDERSSK